MPRYLVLLLLSIPLLAVAGCSDDDQSASESRASSTTTAPKRTALPPGTIAKVEGETINADDVTKVMRLVAPIPSTDNSGIPDPPLFADCIEAGRPTNKGATEEELRAWCARQFEDNRAYTVGYLIKRTWSVLAARSEGVEPTAAEAKKRLLVQLNTTTPAALRRDTLSTDRDREALETVARTQMRDIQLQRVLKAEIGPELAQALLDRYAKRTTCAQEYVKFGIPECNRAIQPF